MLFKAEESQLILNLDNTPMIGVLLALIMMYVICQPPRRDFVGYGNGGCLTGGYQQAEVVKLDIGGDDQLTWNGQALAQAELEQRFHDLAQHGTDNIEIHVYSNARATYRQVAAVFAGAQRHGLTSLGLYDAAP